MNYIKIELSGQYRETGAQTRGIATAARKEGFRFDNFFLLTESVIRKKNITKVLIECSHDFSAGLFSGLEEIRARIEDLKAAGKDVFFYAAAYGVQELFLAAACSHRIMHPMGSVKFHGLSHSFIFAKRMTRHIGIDAEVFRRGDYKSAGDRFRTDVLEGPNREQYQHFLSTVMDVLRKGIIEGFGKTEDDIAELLDGKVLNAEEAQDASWIDEAATCSEFVERWKADKDKEVKFKHTPQKAGKGGLFREQRVAVLVFEGAVIDGRSRQDPLMGQAVGAESFIPKIRKLREDKKVKAVVLRINSGGGSAFASEDITAELRLLASKKPLIVSMSQVAGSGGYWMSCCGSKTFAMPTTLTGSIGVISIYLSLRRLLDTLGITHDTIREGDHSDAGSALRELSEKEKQMIDDEIGEMYAGFLKMVAAKRNKTEDEIDALGRGRVWPGLSAKENGLIDETGGLSAAIASAVEEAGLKRPVVRFYPEVKHGLVERLVMNMSKDDESADAAAIPAGLARLAGLLDRNNISSGPLALMEEVLFQWN